MIITVFNSYNFFYKLPFVFRKNFGTKMTVCECTNFIQQQLENKNICLGNFTDLKKAFDTVNHNILFKKLEHSGIRGLVKK